nr:uncharacterized protein LOC111836354 isoform X1 [Paramormyrops kingsleyae]
MGPKISSGAPGCDSTFYIPAKTNGCVCEFQTRWALPPQLTCFLSFIGLFNCHRLTICARIREELKNNDRTTFCSVTILLLVIYTSWSQSRHQRYNEMTDLQQTFLCAAITEVLPTLPDGSKGILEETLQSLGLETYDDFQFIEEADLLSALKPIQARKVLAAWKLKCQSPESKGSSVHLVVPHQDLPQLCSVFHPDIQPLQAAVKVLI